MLSIRFNLTDHPIYAPIGVLQVKYLCSSQNTGFNVSNEAHMRDMLFFTCNACDTLVPRIALDLPKGVNDTDPLTIERNLFGRVGLSNSRSQIVMWQVLCDIRLF